MISNSYMFHYEENDSITHLECKRRVLNSSADWSQDNVTRKQHVYSLDMDHTVMSLECTANSLTVTTNTTASQVHGFATGHIVTVHIGCVRATPDYRNRFAASGVAKVAAKCERSSALRV